MNTVAPEAPLTIAMDGRFLQDKWDGVGRYAHGLLHGLSQLEGNHRVVLFIDPSLPNTRFDLDQLVQTGKVEIRHMRLPLYHPRELWTWPMLLRNVGAQVFHSPYMWVPLVLPCPLVSTVHDMIFDRYPEYIPGKRFLVPYKIMSRLSLWLSRAVIAVSESTRRDIVQYARVRPNKIVTVLEGVESRFQRITDPVVLDAVRQKYNLPPHFILAIGARRPHKNIPRLVSAYAQIADEVEQSLVLVGSIDTRFSPEAELGELKGRGRIIETGRVDDDDLNALYSLADLFVQPSIIEGFGLPLAEAMACGCAVICSETSSLPEVVGDAALLFDPLDEGAIAAAMREVLTTPGLRDKLAADGLRRAAALNWTSAAEQTLAVFRRAARAA